MSPDDAILSLLAAVPHLNVHDGAVDVDEAEKVILVDLPYVVFWSTPGYDNDGRQSGRVAGRVVEFLIRGVGEDRTQAKWALDQARDALSRRRLGKGLIIRQPDNQPVRRDDDYTRPGGEPLFTGVDKYAVAI